MASRNKSDYNNLFITQNTFRSNELDNSTDLLELKHICYVILLMNSFFFFSDLFFSVYSIYPMVPVKTI